MISVEAVEYRAHRLAFLYMEGQFPRDQVDHINHERNDNRWSNIRHSNYAENMLNKSKYKNSKTVGVHWHSKHRKWYSDLSSNKKRMFLGLFIERWDAICARMSANNKYKVHPNHGR